MQEPPDAKALCRKLTELSQLNDRLEDELIFSRLALDTLSTEALLRLHHRLGSQLHRALKLIQDVALGDVNRSPAKSRRRRG
jgi:hypothetical protein